MSIRVLGSILAVIVVAFGAYYAFAESSNAITIRWVIAHQPTAVFDNARAVFEEELEKKTGRPVTIELLSPEDMGYEDEIPPSEVMKFLDTGEAEIATVIVDSIMTDESDLRVLQLPYLFPDYSSANRVLDGEVGKRLLAEVDLLTGAHALAFTYSGGFRVIASTKSAIREPRDLVGQRITLWGGALVESGIASLGALPVRVGVGQGKDELASGKSDGAQFTYTRAAGSIGDGSSVKYVSETNHILFLSSIIASDAFVTSLSQGEQALLREAAAAAAATERKDSIAYADTVKAGLVAKGVEIVSLSEVGRKTFETWGVQFRAQFDGSENAKSLIRDILSVQGR